MSLQHHHAMTVLVKREKRLAYHGPHGYCKINKSSDRFGLTPRKGSVIFFPLITQERKELILKIMNDCIKK